MQYAKVSTYGYSQEVRIPKIFRFNSDRVKITKYGFELLLEPVHNGFENMKKAAIAIANQITLVTNNIKELANIDKLKIENWI
jgi:virulence-associated protein VagC